jgi:hypothetical protein
MSLDQLLTAIRGNLPVTVGGAVAFLVLTWLFVSQARRRRVIDPAKLVPASAPVPAGSAEHALAWAPPEQSYADRRGSVRREGAPVKVMVSSSSLRNGVNEGYVVDRSTGGLRIVLQNAVPPGSTLQVRAENAPDTVGFVTLIVRSCRKEPDHFIVGTEFEKTPPWNVLLLFG